MDGIRKKIYLAVILFNAYINYIYYSNLSLVINVMILQIVFLFCINYLTKKFSSHIPIEQSNYRDSIKKLFIVSISLLSLSILANQGIYALNLIITGFIAQNIAVSNGYRLAV